MSQEIAHTRAKSSIRTCVHIERDTSCSSKEEASAIALGYGEWANRAGHGYLSLARSFVKERNKCIGITAVET